MTILFHKDHPEHGYLSNFAPSPIELEGAHWPTVEHYFQAQKFPGTEHVEVVRTAATPAIARELGRDRARPIVAHWDETRVAVMRTALRAKFTQHAELRARLLATDEEPLVERAPYDGFWGNGHDGRGKNTLGRMLAELRAELRRE